MALIFLVVLLFAIGYVISGFIIAFRTRNPVTRWGFGITAGLTLLLLLAGAFILFSGAFLPTPAP